MIFFFNDADVHIQGRIHRGPHKKDKLSQMRGEEELILEKDCLGIVVARRFDN